MYTKDMSFKFLQHKFFQDLLAAISGILIALSYAPFNWYIAAFLGLALLLFTLHNASPLCAFWHGFICYFCGECLLMWWVFTTIHQSFHFSIFTSLLFSFCILSLYAICFALSCLLLSFISNKKAFIKYILFFAVIITWQEIIRTYLGLYPIALIGDSQVNSWVGNYAAIFSVYGVSFICCIISGLIFYGFYSKKWLSSTISIGILILCAWISGQIHWTHAQGKPVSVFLFQGDTVYHHPYTQNEYLHNLLFYWKNTKKINLSYKNSLIVWPEDTVIYPLQQIRGLFTDLMKPGIKRNNALILGAKYDAHTPANGTFYNSAILYSQQQQYYFKRQLFPFGERIPLQNLLLRWHVITPAQTTGYLSGLRQQANFNFLHLKIAPFICGEVAYTNLLFPNLPNANILLAISNDGDFKSESLLRLHLQLAKMRAIESGRWFIYVGNMGMSSIIDNHGRLIKVLPSFKANILSASVQAYAGITPYIFLKPKYELLILSIISLFTIIISKVNLVLLKKFV